ncbi:COL12A [Mytilus edulis]|uniref:COL12A n=1 Tax=Mytilus edulis TaxID=6550 RepID=A0A8S3TDQ7_MYTED|nr:COL12A [Mytilus edulis]
MTKLSASLLVLLVAVTITESRLPKKFPGNLDLVFILDSSGSVGTSNFLIMKRFASNITLSFKIGETLTQVGLDVFSSTVTTEIKLKEFNTCAGCLRAKILRAKYKGKMTKTFFALDHARFNSFSTHYGARIGVPKIAVVMTDGKSQEKDKTCESAKYLRNSGVIIIVIIIGNKVDMEEIQCIASGPSFIFTVQNFSGLKKRGFRDRVARKLFSDKIAAV